MRYVALMLVLVFISFSPAKSYLLSKGPPIDDDADYLSHAFTFGIDGDLDYSNELAETFTISPDRHPVPRGFIGTGLMAAPFVALFSLIDRATDHPILTNRSEFLGSWSMFGFLLAQSVFLLLSIILYFLIINHFVRARFFDSFLWVASSGILFYILFRFTMSHGAEFFLAACTLWTSIKFFSYSSLRSHTLFGALIIISITLSLLTRSANLNILWLPLIAYLFELFFRSPSKKFSWRTVLSLGGLALAALILFAAVNYWYYGLAYPDFGAYVGKRFGAGEGVLTKLSILFDVLPNFWLLVFSSEFGLLYSNPVLVFGITFFLAMFIFNPRPWYQKSAALLLGFAYIGLPISIVLIWKTTASSYGYRYLYSLFPLGVLGLIHLKTAYIPKYKWARVVSLTLGLFILVGILSQVFFPIVGVRDQMNVFGVQHFASANGYYFSLFKAIASPASWLGLFALSGVGVITIKFLGMMGVDFYALNDKLANFSHEKVSSLVEKSLQLHGVQIIQICLFLCLWMIAIVYFHIRLQKVSRGLIQPDNIR